MRIKRFLSRYTPYTTDSWSKSQLENIFTSDRTEPTQCVLPIYSNTQNNIFSFFKETNSYSDSIIVQEAAEFL